MENRKTSMQELFDNLQAIDIAVPIGVKQIFLEKEKEQITDAFYSGYEDRDLFQHGQDYYNKIYIDTLIANNEKTEHIIKPNK